MRTVVAALALLFATTALTGRLIDGIYYQWCCDPIPTLTCQSHVTCDLELPVGDQLNPDRPAIGDQTDWMIYAQPGAGASIYFEPLRDHAAATLLTIPRANAPRSPYHVWLRWVPHVQHPVYSFYAVLPHVALAPTPEPEAPLVLTLRGKYVITGKAPFHIARIGNDGVRTYIFLPHMRSYPVPIPLSVHGQPEASNVAAHVLPNLGRELIVPGVPTRMILTLGGGKRRVFLTIHCVDDCS